MATRSAQRSSSVRIARIGITGMIGSGKSTVAAIIRDQGHLLLDSDRIGGELLDGDARVRREVQSLFGGDVIGPGGRVNRTRVAEAAFTDAAKLRALNAIIHPRVLSILERKIRDASRDGRKIVFVESALIFEAELEENFNYVIVVASPVDMIFDRLHLRTEAEKEQILRRMSAQLPQEEKMRMADFTIFNDGTRAELKSRTLFILGIVNALCALP